MSDRTTFIFNGHIATVLGRFADFTKISYTDDDGSIVIVHIPRTGICDPYVVAE